MDKLFGSQWVLRITALILALLLAIYVKAIISADSDFLKTDADILTNVPLEVYYDDENLLVTGIPETVNVRIEGPMQIVQQTKLLKDYKVFVKLNALLIGEHSVTVLSENFSDKLKVTIDPAILNVVIEERVTKEFRVDFEMNNRLIAEDYSLKGMTADPNKVLISGAKSVIESISYVKATVAGEAGINASFIQEANVKVLDRDLNKLGVTIEPEKVKVKVEIIEYSRELPITIKQTGEAQTGVIIDKLSVEPSKILVYGTRTAIDSLTEVIVDVDISKINESGSYEMDVAVPTGAAKLSQEKIIIHADVTKEIVEEAQSETTESETEDVADEGN